MILEKLKELNLNRNKIMLYFIIVLSILCSGTVFFYLKYSKITLIILLTCSVLMVIKNKYLNFYNSMVALIFVLILIINFYIFQGPVSSVIGTSICFISMSIMCSNMSFDEYKHMYINVLTIMSLISLLFFIGSIFWSHLFYTFSKLGEVKGKVFMYSPLFTWGWGGFYGRNHGMFWEPGCFQAFINVAIFFIDRNENKRLYKSAILLVTLLTTFSTTGYLVLLIVLLYKFYNLKICKKTKLIVLLVYIVIFGIVFQSNVVQKKLFTTNISTTIRVNDFLNSLKVINEVPMIGYGFNSKLLQNRYDAYGIVNNSNGILSFCASFGVPVSILYFLLLFMNMKSIYRKNAIFIFLILFIFYSTEMIMLLPTYLCFIYKFNDSVTEQKFKIIE